MADMPPPEGEPLPIDTADDDAITLSVLDAIQQLIDERHELEEFVKEKFGALAQLRDELRSESTSAGRELQQQVDELRRERDAALAQVDALTREVRRVKLGEQLAADELAQARQEVEHQRRHSAEFQRLLDALRDQLTRQEQQSRADAERYADMAREHAEWKGIMEGFERAEAELRQEQEAVRKERERLKTSDSGRFTAVSPPSSPSIVIGAGDQRFLSFTCKHCGAALQAKEHLAGLIMRCSQCSKMAPVPKAAGA